MEPVEAVTGPTECLEDSVELVEVGAEVVPFGKVNIAREVNKKYFADYAHAYRKSSEKRRVKGVDKKYHAGL